MKFPLVSVSQATQQVNDGQKVEGESGRSSARRTVCRSCLEARRVLGRLPRPARANRSSSLSCATSSKAGGGTRRGTSIPAARRLVTSEEFPNQSRSMMVKPTSHTSQTRSTNSLKTRVRPASDQPLPFHSWCLHYVRGKARDDAGRLCLIQEGNDPRVGMDCFFFVRSWYGQNPCPCSRRCVRCCILCNGYEGRGHYAVSVVAQGLRCTGRARVVLV